MKHESLPSELTIQVFTYFAVAAFLVVIGAFTIHSGIVVAISVWIAAALLAAYASYIAICMKNDRLIVVTGVVSEVAMSNTPKLLRAVGSKQNAVKYVVLKDDSGQFVRINTHKRLSIVPEKGDSISIYLTPRTQIYKLDGTLIPADYLTVSVRSNA